MPKLSEDQKSQIATIRPLAESKRARESEAVNTASARQEAIEMAKQKDIKDRSHAEQALVNEGNLQILANLYETLPDDSQYAASLGAVIQSMTADSLSLAQPTDDAPPA